MMAAVYLQTSDMALVTGAQYAEMAAAEGGAFAAPIAFRNSHLGPPVAGATADFVTHLAGPLAEGRVFAASVEAMGGAHAPVAVCESSTPVHRPHRQRVGPRHPDACRGGVGGLRPVQRPRTWRQPDRPALRPRADARHPGGAGARDRALGQRRAQVAVHAGRPDGVLPRHGAGATAWSDARRARGDAADGCADTGAGQVVGADRADDPRAAHRPKPCPAARHWSPAALCLCGGLALFRSADPHRGALGPLLRLGRRTGALARRHGELVGISCGAAGQSWAVLPGLPIPTGSELDLEPKVLALRWTAVPIDLVEGADLDIAVDLGSERLQAEVEIGARDAAAHGHAGHNH
jgi:hypothetical protein